MTDTLHHTENETYDARMLREKAVAAKEAVTELAGEVKHYAVDRLGRVKEQAGETFRDANDTVVDFVRKYPYKSLAIAAGVGLALGILLKRR